MLAASRLDIASMGRSLCVSRLNILHVRRPFVRRSLPPSLPQRCVCLCAWRNMYSSTHSHSSPGRQLQSHVLYVPPPSVKRVELQAAAAAVRRETVTTTTMTFDIDKLPPPPPHGEQLISTTTTTSFPYFSSGFCCHLFFISFFSPILNADGNSR